MADEDFDGLLSPLTTLLQIIKVEIYRAVVADVLSSHKAMRNNMCLKIH